MEVSSSFAECTANLKSSESTASHLETKLNSQKEDASSDAAESHKKLMTAQAEVKRVTKEWNAAKEKITELQTHNTFHKDISSSGYCNYTAIMDDANNTLHTFKNKAAEVKDVATKKVVNMAVITTDLASEGMERAQIGLLKAGDLTKISLDASKKYWAIGKDYALVGFEQISEASKPHIEQGVKTTKNLYDSHVKDIVDEKVAPVYKEKVAPHFQLASEKIVEGWEVASPKITEISTLASNAYTSGRISLVTIMVDFSKVLTEKLATEERFDGVRSKLTWLTEEEGANDAVGYALWFVAFLFAYRFLSPLLWLFFGLVRITLRIVFFFPLLFVGGGGKKKRSLVDDEDVSVEEIYSN
ncbi:hypothetical protein ScalyP_jg5548 [Parmales sp. scaly parma]|nr:hypothetical protein ScalyP_jg5548 [Parmales sp. scaly parma]